MNLEFGQFKHHWCALPCRRALPRNTSTNPQIVTGLSAGSYSIRATPYSLVGGDGAAGGSLGISFRVVD